jgi:transposase
MEWSGHAPALPARMLAGGTEDKEHAISQKLDTSPAAIGIDIGKNSFHIVGQNQRGAIVLRQKRSRGQVEARLANLPPCRIGMEACVGAHLHNGRAFEASYSKGQKNDFRDAEAIAEAVQRPTMKFVATKTADTRLNATPNMSVEGYGKAATSSRGCTGSASGREDARPIARTTRTLISRAEQKVRSHIASAASMRGARR